MYHFITMYVCLQAVLVENAHLKATIQKLRTENDELMRHARIADCNAHHMRVRIYSTYIQ